MCTGTVVVISVDQTHQNKQIFSSILHKSFHTVHYIYVVTIRQRIYLKILDPLDNTSIRLVFK